MHVASEMSGRWCSGKVTGTMDTGAGSGTGRTLCRGALVLVVAFLLSALLVAVVRAAAVTVNIQTDSVSACASSGTGNCSLRDAVLYANANAGTAISVPAGTYTLTIAPTGGNDAN